MERALPPYDVMTLQQFAGDKEKSATSHPQMWFDMSYHCPAADMWKGENSTNVE